MAKGANKFMAPVRVDAVLAEVVGAEPLPRTEIAKRLWAYIKEHKLQNPDNKREIIADAKLRPVFGCAKADMLKMTSLVNAHILK
jgi:chromatin remodeling complex protein RSC6